MSRTGQAGVGNADAASGKSTGEGIGKDNPSQKPKPLFERAQQTLYPQQDEQKPLLGVGVSQGMSRVRKAPKLSALIVRRAQFGWG